ncbi:conjugative transposon protein TraM [Chryseobacterium oncorhynchi]|uniref:Conjugative transposon TraM C-terminal domain-containing protein n=1 Tax=Chryseobacterium oncorhynchi TaxID=741074 RepID=A0A316WFT6_9FLAO|nr:conjugative transposon protein TraM [Chryseobacterium oncorhynchi]PWN59979.1 hypothetical protein C1638_020645 [Chryseobacterium oncorhynchi]
MKDLLQKIKSDPVLKQKVIRAGIFFGLFIIGIIGFYIYNESNAKPSVIDKDNQINGRIIPADTASLGVEKTEFYTRQNQDSIVQVQATSETVLGGSVVQKNKMQEDNNAVLNEYMANRQASIQKMQKSSDTYVPSASSSDNYSRRKYNPNGNSSDWTTDKTTVTSSKPVRDVPVIGTYTRSYNPDNPSASTVDYNNQQVTQSQQKELTKEEKLQLAIASKYSKGSASGDQGITVTAQIYNNQKINSNNTSVRIVLLDKLYINNTTIGTDAFIYGIANVGQNRLTITVPNISYKGRNYPVNLIVYDYRTGEQGIPIKQENIVGSMSREAENQINQEASSRLGRVGSILTSVMSGRNKSVSIQLNDGHKIYLKSKN